MFYPIALYRSLGTRWFRYRWWGITISMGAWLVMFLLFVQWNPAWSRARSLRVLIIFVGLVLFLGGSGVSATALGFGPTRWNRAASAKARHGWWAVPLRLSDAWLVFGVTVWWAATVFMLAFFVWNFMPLLWKS